MTRLGFTVRAALLAAAAVALAASSSKPTPPINQPYPQSGQQPAAPPPQGMDPRAPLGLWTTNFGAVKLESDGAGLHGAWTYDRDGQQVIGYFAGALEGNVLRLTWREPAQPVGGGPQLAGQGWLAFDPSGTSFAGRWWTDDGQRSGDWTGTRAAQPLSDVADPAAYGGATYGGSYPPPPPAPYPQPQPYPQPSPYPYR